MPVINLMEAYTMRAIEVAAIEVSAMSFRVRTNEVARPVAPQDRVCDS